MANDKAINLYNYTTGIVCILLIILSTVIYGVNISDGFLFFILIGANIIIDRFRIVIGRLNLTLITIIELSAFLIFGLVESVWIQFISIFIIDYILYKKPFRTVLINIAMISSSIFVGGMAFNFVSDLMANTSVRYLSINGLVSAAVFMLSSIIVNYTFIYIQFILIDKKLIKQMLLNSFLWELVSTLISIPISLGFTDIYLFSQGNNLLFSVLFLLPVIFISFIFSLIKKVIFANKQLRALSKVALTINSCLDLDKTNNYIIDAIGSLVSFKGCYIFDINENKSEMQLTAFRVDNVSNPKMYKFNIKNGMFQRIIESEKPIIINDLNSVRFNDEDQYSNIYKSCILVPMKRLNECVGCIGIFSDESHAFNNDILEFLIILSDQAAIAIENARILKFAEKEAITDGLTNLYNHRYFYDCLGRKISQFKLLNKKISLIILDIDHFKDINDTYGHRVGDFVLKEIAGLIKSCVRKEDIVARYGGEEFTVILPEIDASGAFVIGERIRSKVENYDFIINKLNIKVTISGGISEYPKTASNDVELVNYADRAMYIGAKNGGRNKIIVYDEKLS